MSYKQNLTITEHSQFQPAADSSPNAKLSTIFKRQKLDPIPLLKQKLPHPRYLSNNEPRV